MPRKVRELIKELKEAGFVDRVNMRPILYAVAIVLLTGMATGEVEAAEETLPPHYTDIDVDTKVTVEAKIEEVDKDYNIHSETTGKVTVRVQDEESGAYVEAEVSKSDEEERAGVRVGIQF